MSSQLPQGATAQTYATTLMTAYNSNGTTPTDKPKQRRTLRIPLTGEEVEY